MAFQRIRIKNTNVAGKVPGADKLDTAELCVNLKDHKLYSKDADDNVFEIGAASVGSGPTPPTNDNEAGDLWWDGDFLLVWNGSDWEKVGGVTSVNGETGDVVLGLGDINDVTLTNIDTGDIVVWNGTAWVNTALPAVPEKTSDLTNDGENGTDPFITEADVNSILDGSTGGNVYIKEGDNVSLLNNDAGFITDAGVTKIIAGNNVAIDPADGTGEVTINAATGGGGGIEEAPLDGQIYGRQSADWVILDIPEAAPMELTAELAVSGENNVSVEWGETLRAVPTVIGGAQPVRITYQWWNDFGVIISDISISGATNATYEIPETKIGFSIWCKVTATDALGVTEEANTNRCIVTGQASPDIGDNNLGDLGDINLDGLDDDYILVWNEAESEWQVEPKPDPGVTKIIAGTGIEVAPVEGTGDVTINSTISATEFVGPVDVTSSTVPAMVRSANALYVNTGTGTFSPEWAAVTSNADVTTEATPGDFMMKDLESQASDPWTFIDSNIEPSTDGLWIEDSGKLYPATLTNNVGIGTDSPVNRLHVAGNIQQETGQAIFSNHYYKGEWKAIDESKPGGYINLCDNDGKLVLGNGPGNEPPTQKLVILQSGNVGIGTDLPAQQLHVQPAADNGGILVSSTQSNNFISCTASDKDTGYRFGYSKTAGGLIQRCDGKGNYISNTMVFTDSNDVGIGTTTPAEKLHVNGKVRANDYDLEALPPLSTAP